MTRFLFLITIFVLSSVTGCAPGNSSDKSIPDKIVAWHWMTDREDAFTELAA